MPSLAANVTPAMTARPSQTDTDIAPPVLKLPAGLTFAGLVGGIVLGLLLAGTSTEELVLQVAEPVGSLWLRALQMTIIPLVAALLVVGIGKMVATARAGAMAKTTLVGIFSILAAGTIFAAFAMPALLALFPVPIEAGQVLAAETVEPQQVPGLGDFLTSLVSPNIIAAAAETQMLPLIIFFGALGFAIARLPEARRAQMAGFFAALADAMLVIVGWVLWLAPVGVFALATGMAARAGAGAIAALGHYILTVSAMGFVVFVAAYVVAWAGAGFSPLRFGRAIVPAQAVALSTQSSLASLPPMLESCRRLGIRAAAADFVLPLAVAIFRATSPAMNLAVAIYVAVLTGVELTPGVLAAGAAVALVTTIGSVSLPGSVSFVTSIGPIALAMGVPIGPLALLVAVEMIPDLMRTVGNVTMNVALAGTVDRRTGGAAEA